MERSETLGLRRRRIGALALAAALFAAVLPLAGPAGAAGTFSDDDGNIHEANIETLAANGITQGCNPPQNNLFCPGESVTRAQMATFLVRALDLTPLNNGPFTDIAGSVHKNNINALYAEGITQGCNPPANTRYCPDSPVTRAQMATFLTRALDYTPTSNGPFTDISGSVHKNNINALYAEGVTQGCNPPTNTQYCPDNPVTRAQMATFLVRALDLTNPNPTTTTTSTTSTTSTTTTTTMPPGPSAWSTAPTDVSPGVLDPGYATIGSNLYVVGGKTNATTRVTTFRRYDMQADSWTTLAPIPGAGREDIALVAQGGLIYAFGGATTAFFSGDSVIAAVYDPGSNTWDDAAVADLSASRSAAQAVLWNGDIWIIGGFDSSGNSLDTVLVYDPDSDTYSDGPDLPVARDTARAAIQNDGTGNRLYVFGGRNSQGSPPLTKTASWVLNAGGTDWDDIAPMPTARRNFVAAPVSGRIILFGGENENGVVGAVHEYNPVTDTWTTLSGQDWPAPRHGPAGGVATVSGEVTVFLHGGAQNSGASGITAANDSFIRANVP